MKAASVSQMRAIDNSTINKYGIAGSVLMENAGVCVINEVLENTSSNSFVVLCGKGNNGGDGSVVARHLYNKGKKVVLVLVANEENLSGDAKTNFNIARKIGVPIEIGLTDNAKMAISSCEVIIDALLGIGTTSNPREKVAQAIEIINNANKIVFAVDVPSGINSDTGEVYNPCVKANFTITFGLYKIGLACYPAREYAGRVKVCDISFAQKAIDDENINVNIIEEAQLPPRTQNTHKGSFGRVFALAGSIGFTGAAYLTVTAAMRTGCGLATLGIPYSLNSILEQKLTEVMTLPLADNDGVLSKDALCGIKRAMIGSDVIICGCGLGNNEDIYEIVAELIKTSQIPIVLDADGINALKGHTDILKGKNCEIVITPHIGEMARITGLSIEQVKSNTLQVAQSFATEYNIVTVLKSAHTIVALPNGEAYINIYGNSGMATAGSGDVLAGIIGSLIAQGVPPIRAATNGVYIHSRAGDIAAQKLGEHSLLATDILDNISNVGREDYVGKSI